MRITGPKPSADLTKAQCEEIIALVLKGVKRRDIMYQFAISEGRLRKIINLDYTGVDDNDKQAKR